MDNPIKPKMRKIIGLIQEDDMQLIEQACAIEKRNKISLIRKASLEYAKKILGENQNKQMEVSAV